MARRGRMGADSAGTGPDPASAGRLSSLDDVKGLDVAKGEPDIRGWEVRTISGRRIGEVDDLLVDESRNEVVMLDISLHDGDRHVEVPIRAAQLDRSRHHVIIDSRDAEPVGDMYDRQSRERLASEERADRLAQERADRLAMEDRERKERLSAEDRMRAAERMSGERAMRGERTIREQGRPVRASERGEGGVEEVVVEQRPIVMEETVVRRRPVGEEDLDSDRTDRDRS